MKPSIHMKVLGAVLRAQPNVFADPVTFKANLLKRAYPQVAPPPASLQLQAYIAHDQLCGHAVFRLEPQAEATDWHILYIHGGGYVQELIAPHWAIIEQLMRATGSTVTAPIYPLAPEHTYLEAHAFMLDVYRKVLSRTPPERVVFCGDSAGAGFCVALTQACQDARLPLPAHLILFSPWVDVTMPAPEIADIAPKDPLLARPGAVVAGELWAGHDSPLNPAVSPTYRPLAGLPPMDLFVGTNDIVLPDVRTFVQKARTAGGQVGLHEYPEAYHVFMAAAFTPEAQDVYRKIRTILRTETYQIKLDGLTRLVSSPPVRLAALIRDRRQGKGAANLRP